MGTSFECQFMVSASPRSGDLVLNIGPVNMGNLAELLDYLASAEARESILEGATKALCGNEADHPAQLIVHLRGTTTTVCGLHLWTYDELGHRVSALASVGHRKVNQYPVTCPGCLVWMEQTGFQQ